MLSVTRAGAVIAALILCQWAPVAGALEVGDAAPVLQGPTLDGGQFGAEQVAGKIVLVDFWATWCPPCVAELPDLAAVAERFAPQGLRVLAVSVDGTAPGEVPGPDEVLAYAEDRGLALPILYFDGDPVELDERYDLPGPYPSTLVLGAGGRPLEVHAGTATRDQFEELARLALQGAE